MNKKVAILISVYKNDKLEFFKESLESIKNQSYGFENINIYLGIDGKIPKDIENFIETNKSLFYKIIKNDSNKGLAYTLNRLIDALEDEEYICRMDADDICKLDRVEKQISYMEHNPNILICGGSIEEIDEKGNIIIQRKYPKTTKEAKKYIPKASIFAHMTVCFRKSFFEKRFRYNPDYRFNQDLALWYEAIVKNIEIANIDDIIVSVRVLDGFYKRRSYKRAFGEFMIYYNGIKKLYGFNWRLIYPVFRLLTRLMPPFIVKLIYNGRFRKILNR